MRKLARSRYSRVMRPLRVASALLLFAASSCGQPDVGSRGLAINDPLALIDDVQGPLRLFVLPAETHTCDATTGMVSPEIPDVGEGMVMEAVADLSLDVTDSRAMAELDVPGGDYTVLVRGKGTDPVTMIPDTFIATGCASPSIENGATREVRITLLPIVGMGVCGDGTLSPDEQCEDGNTSDGDGCSATCRTEPFTISTTAGTLEAPSVGGAAGQRWSAAWNADNTTVRLRTLNPDGSTIMTPSVLMVDQSIKDVFGGLGLSAVLFADVAVHSDGSIAMAFADFNVPRRYRVGLFDAMRASRGPPVELPQAMMPEPPSIAYAGNGAAMAVFSDPASGTGLSGVVFAAGATTAGTPFEVGGGLSGASSPDVAGTADGFVVAMTAGGDVHMQRFGSDGTARDASAVTVAADAGTQEQPAVGAMTSGEILVVWRDELADGAGTGIGARAFAADGTPQQDPFVLNTETGGAQERPAVTAGPDGFAAVWVSGGTGRGRYVSSTGEPLPNREQPPTTADFEVAASASDVDVATGGSGTEPRWMVVAQGGSEITARFFAF